MTPPHTMRLLMTADAVGGVWTYAISLARELSRRGIRIHLLTLGPAPREEQRREAEAIPGLDLVSTDLALEWLDPKGKDFPRALEVLAYHAERIKPDIVHINGYREALAEWNAPIIVVAHSCVRSWWRACRHEEPDQRWRNYIANVHAGLNAADRWLAPTAAFRGQIEMLYVPLTRGSVIWNGAAGEYQNAPAKEPFVLAAGRLWDEAKNIALLARAADDVPWPIFAAGAAESPGKGEAQRLDRIR
ncbi:MAG TPA: glycosyltransferase family 4 protein, partial [Xanthobacteraceae bacterium]|nr:glycosyltransferase family 4 protein [Xanthobacteraceae bacterium]